MPYWSPSVSIHTCFIRSSLALNVPPPPDLLLCSRYRVSAKFVMLLHQLIYDCILQPTSLTFGLLVCLPDLSQSHHTPNLQSSTCSAICNARPSTIHSISTPAAIRSQCQPGLNSCLWVTKMSLTLTELGEMGVKEVKGANEPVFMFLSRWWLIHEGFFYQSLNCSWESPLFMFEFERQWLKWVCWSCSLHISFAARMRFACDFDDPPSFHFIEISKSTQQIISQIHWMTCSREEEHTLYCAFH